MKPLDDVLQAAEWLVRASLLLRVGETRGCAKDSHEACDLAIKALMEYRSSSTTSPESRASASRYSGDDFYAEREDFAVKHRLVTRAQYEELRKLRRTDRFREITQKQDGLVFRKEVVLSESQAQRALTLAHEVLQRIAEQLPSPVREAFLQALGAFDTEGPEERELDDLEVRAGRGFYDADLILRLTHAEATFASRPSEQAVRHRTRVVTLRGHVALMQGRLDGPAGALVLGQNTLSAWTRFNNAERVVHCSNILSIAYRARNLLRQASKIMDEAEPWAQRSRELGERILMERAAILSSQGRADVAASSLVSAIAAAEARGDTPRKGLLLQKRGKALLRAGSLKDAERDLLRSAGEILPGYLLAQCATALALAEVYARLLAKSEARVWSDSAQRLASHGEYASMLSAIESLIRRYPAVWE